MQVVLVNESISDLAGIAPIRRALYDTGIQPLTVSSEEECSLEGLPLEAHPDYIIYLGDRVKTLKIVLTLREKFPLAKFCHLSGGDFQEGRLADEPVRACLTAFADFNFACTEKSKVRLEADRNTRNSVIINTGSTMVDGLLYFVPKKENYRENILIIIHPCQNWLSFFEEGNLERLLKFRNLTLCETNGDSGFRNLDFRTISSKYKSVKILRRVQRQEFLNAAWNAHCVIGNSSSLFLELQYLGCPIVHVTERNQGREEAFPGHVVKNEGKDILKDIKKASTLKDSRSSLGLRADWFLGAHGAGGSAHKIVPILKYYLRKKM